MQPHAALALFIALAAYAAVSELDYLDALLVQRCQSLVIAQE